MSALGDFKIYGLWRRCVAPSCFRIQCQRAL